VKSMYLDLIDTGPLSRSLHFWKIKVPLRIKIFMWFVHKGVILTKDNLTKRNWVGNSRCCFCDHNESIKHLFLECPLAKLLWRSIHIAFNVNPPSSMHTLFGTWLNGVDNHLAKHIRIGICALFWAIWNTRNDLIFNGTQFTNFLQVIYKATTWIRMWSSLTHADFRELLVIGCNRWEMVARAIYSRFGWKANNKLGV
jgi:hypothetical protein